MKSEHNYEHMRKFTSKMTKNVLEEKSLQVERCSNPETLRFPCSRGNFIMLSQGRGRTIYFLRMWIGPKAVTKKCMCGVYDFIAESTATHLWQR